MIQAHDRFRGRKENLIYQGKEDEQKVLRKGAWIGSSNMDKLESFSFSQINNSYPSTFKGHTGDVRASERMYASPQLNWLLGGSVRWPTTFYSFTLCVFVLRGYRCTMVCMCVSYVVCMWSSVCWWSGYMWCVVCVCCECMWYGVCMLGVCVAWGMLVCMCVVCVWCVCSMCVFMKNAYDVCGVHVLCVYSMWCVCEVFVWCVICVCGVCVC